MASFRRQKEALRIVAMAYLAGAHNVTVEGERSQGVSLQADFERLCASPMAVELFCEILNEEDLYPFGSEWPRDALAALISKLIPPKDDELRFRFRKGFKELLATVAGELEGRQESRSVLDHWMVLLINASFHAGMLVAARSSDNPKIYYDVIPSIEEETDPWTRYPQLQKLLDKQLRRETKRRTGLVTDLDYE